MLSPNRTLRPIWGCPRARGTAERQIGCGKSSTTGSPRARGRGGESKGKYFPFEGSPPDVATPRPRPAGWQVGAPGRPLGRRHAAELSRGQAVRDGGVITAQAGDDARGG